MGVAFGDYLHNGRMSLLLSHFDIEYAALYRNDGGMNFTDMSIASGIARGTQGYVGWGDAFVDFDNDGWQDFFLVNGHVYPQVDQARTGHPISGAEVSIYQSTKRNLQEHQQAGWRGDSDSASEPRACSGRSFQRRKDGGGGRKPGGPADDSASRRRATEPLGQFSTGRRKEQSSSIECARACHGRRFGATGRSRQRRKLPVTARSAPSLRARRS